MFFRNRQKSNKKSDVRVNRPSDTVTLSQNLAAAVWKSDTSGLSAPRFHFALRRQGHDGRLFSTLTPESIMEIPAATERLAAIFASSGAVPRPLRGQLEELSLRLQGLIEEFKIAQEGNGVDKDVKSLLR